MYDIAYNIADGYWSCLTPTLLIGIRVISNKQAINIDGERIMERKYEKVKVTKVVCDGCKDFGVFALYRKVSDPLNYILECTICKKKKEFRVFLIWDVDVDKMETSKTTTSLGLWKKGVKERNKIARDRIMDSDVPG